MMHDRLLLSKRLLLKNSHSLVIAIDENEQERLGLLLGQVFPGQHRILVTVVHNPRGILSKNFSNTNEYCYFVIPSSNVKHVAMRKREDYSLANLNLRDKGSESLRTDAKTCFYPFIVEGDKIVGVGSVPADSFHPSGQTVDLGDGKFEVWPIDTKGVERKWRYSVNKYDTIKDILRAKRHSATRIDINIYKDTQNYKTVWDDNEYNAGLYGTKELRKILPNNKFSFPKSLYLVKDCCRAGLNEDADGIVLDFFAGSGTTGQAIMSLNREDQGRRKYILVEMGSHFEDVMKPRISKSIYSENWEHGRPTSRHAGISHCFKYFRLESFEDTLNSLEFDDSKVRSRILDANPRLREDYILRYMFDVESQGSQSLLNIDVFSDPTSYSLKVKEPGTDRYITQTVDLLETFNYLLGLRVRCISNPESFTAFFERVLDPDIPDDQSQKLALKQELQLDDAGQYWFRVVEGWIPREPLSPDDSAKDEVLIIWRKLTGDIEKDNLVLNKWFKTTIVDDKSIDFNLIYVNGSSNLMTLREADDKWRVSLIEEKFLRCMWEAAD